MPSTCVRPPQTGNNAPLLSNNAASKALMLLNIAAFRPNLGCMKNIALSFILICALSSAAAAQCYADYKAKQDNPLRLHYGVAQISGACSTGSAAQELGPRLASQGWTLLQVESVFGPEGLNQRRDSAGPYYLRF